MTAPLITCEVVADLACPFCFIGATKLMEALESRGSWAGWPLRSEAIADADCAGATMRVEVKFVPFFLNPDLEVPADGMEFSDYMREAGKVGDVHNEGNAAETVTQLRSMAATCAPPLEMACLGEGNKVRPTLDALAAALVIAPRCPCGNLAAAATMMALFRANFEDGANIADAQVLRDVLAVTAPGLSESDCRDIGSEGVREELRQMESSARFLHRAQGVPLFRMKVEGVPLPDGRVVCPTGVQQPETFGRVFDHLLSLKGKV